MRTVTTKTKSTSTQSTVTKTNYWLNIKSSVSNVGINLASGIAQHDVWLELISDVGIDALNDYLTEQNEPYYVVEEGKSSKATHIKSLAERIKAKA